MKPNWINIQDALPTEDGTFLVTDNEVIDLGIWDHRAQMFFESRCEDLDITHWMELPWTPAEQDKESSSCKQKKRK